MKEWVRDELQYADLGDKRLNERLMRLVDALVARPTASVPQAFAGERAAIKGAYRFWASAQVEAAAIRQAHHRRTGDRVSDAGLVLVIQDTTDLDLTHHPKTTGLGPLAHPQHQGLKVHSALAVSTEGVPLGLVAQHVWARDPTTVGQRHTRRQRATADKESQRWLDGLADTHSVVPQTQPMLTVADREADIYDLFAAPRPTASHLLIRGTHERRVAEEAEYVWPTVRHSPLRGTSTVRVGRRGETPERVAEVSVRFTSVTIQPPAHRRPRQAGSPIALWAVLIEEPHPPQGVDGLCWLLLTTCPITTFEEARQCAQWYSYRWLIERYHFVLKSGCRLEDLQLQAADRVERALATYSIVAWRLLWLTYEARRAPHTPCDQVLEEHEWQALYCTIHKTPQAPSQPPSLQQAVHWIARLGGFLDRRLDGEPGVKTIWQGLRRLSDIAATYQLLRSAPSPPLDA